MTERQMKEVNRQKSTTASTEKNVFQEEEEEEAFLLCLLCICVCRSVSQSACGLLSLGVRFFSDKTLNTKTLQNIP